MNNRPARLGLTFALCSGYFMVLLEVTVVNVALPSMGAALHPSAAGLAWIVDAYAVPLAALLLASGAMGDQLGHRRVVVVGFLGFGAASVVCALAPTVLVLVLGRLVQGTAAALMLPGTLALLTESAPDPATRTRIVGSWAALGGAALPAGPLVGGVLVQHLGWQAIFWGNVPVIALAVIPIIAIPRVVPERPPTQGRVDWPGALVLTALIGSTVTVVIEASPRPVVAMLAALVAVLAAVAMTMVQRSTTAPLLRMDSSTRRPLIWASAVAGLMNLCSVGSLFVLTQVFQGVRHLSPLASGALLLPAMLPLPLLGRPAGRVINAFGTWTTAAAALAVSAVGFVVIALALTGSTVMLTIGLTLWGSGLGILTPAVVTAALQAAPQTPGTASGASNTARQVGGAVGVAIASAVAGAPGGPQFVHHTTGILLGASAAFTFAAVLAARIASAAGRAR